MLKKTITYTDYNGSERTEDFYFNLTETEIMEMFAKLHDESEFSDINRGLDEMIKDIIDAKSTSELIATFKELINMAYGKKSPDGRRFIKSEEITLEFTQTEAYSKLFMELAFDADAAANFVNGIIPQKITSLPVEN